MKFQTVKSEETKYAEKIFREIVENMKRNGFYELVLYDKIIKQKSNVKIPICYELEDEYPIVILSKDSNISSWTIPRKLLNLPNNEILYNKYHSLKRSIDFVFVCNGNIEWKRDKKIYVKDCEGVERFRMGCVIGFELVYKCDVDNSKYNDLKKYDIEPIYKIDTLELIKLYDDYKKEDSLPQYIPVTKII